jgi:opacity protein-like surface antigen
MKSRLFALLALATLAAPAICQATPPRPGPYFSGFVGVTIPNDTTTDASASALPLNDRIEFDTSYNLGGTAGFDFGFLRLEGELSYKNGEIATINDRINGARFHDVDGRIGAFAMMGNAFLDLRNPGPITPYFGGGLGFASLHQSDTFSSFGTRLYRSDTDAVFAYQVGGGLEVALTRQLSLDLGYRYFGTSQATFNQGDPNFENRMRFESHNFAAGVRMKFW